MIRDIRVLILYKQHYLDEYKRDMERCQYSCWGYYDGMSVERVEKSDSKLFEKRSASPISDLWYHTVGSASKLEARYGEQNIGLFRCVSKSEDEICRKFWECHERMPYFAVAFLQLYEKKRYKDVRDAIESKYQNNERASCYNLLAYCTFDNADLVILLHGNSITKLEDILKEIEERDDVAYLHPVMGASEKYLQEDELAFWNELDCNIGETIAELRISVSSSGNKDILHWIRMQLSQIFREKLENIYYSRVLGHKDLVFSIRNTTVKMLLTFIRKNGFATHQNVLYENGVYNIESSVCIKANTMEDVPGKELPGRKGAENTTSGWCYDMIKTYVQRFKRWKIDGNESMYSYYQALLQTLNSLGQYEQFGLANGIFYQLFPSFRMFLKQLDTALEKAEKNQDNKMLEKIKESVCQYLESVNSVMYHTTHTDQMFLMIPGCSGTTFSIPIKLSLLYSWLCGRVIDILNDSQIVTDGKNKEYEYQCLITPAMEAKPGTEPIGFGLGHGDRLVQVKLSQRSLYMPRALMIILTHELAHYVGEEVRQRKYRAEEIIRALAALLTEGIIPDEYPDDPDILEEFNNANREMMQRHIIERLKIKLQNSCEESGYHASYIANELITGCKEILASEGAGLEQIIYKVPKKILEGIRSNDENSRRKMKYLKLFQEKCDRNRELLLVTSTDNLDRIVNDLIRICREVFSDTAAYAVLDFELEIFGEAFDISEGVADEEKYDECQSVRKEVIKYLASERKNKSKPAPEYVDGRRKDDEIGTPVHIGNKAENLRYNLFAYDCTKELLKRYAKKCYEVLEERVNEKEKEKEAIKELFEMFIKREGYTCSQIFEAIYEKIEEYTREVGRSFHKSGA